MAFSLVFYCSLFKLYIITHIIFVNLFNNFHTFIIKFVYYKGKYVKTNNYDITFKDGTYTINPLSIDKGTVVLGNVLKYTGEKH